MSKHEVRASLKQSAQKKRSQDYTSSKLKITWLQSVEGIKWDMVVAWYN